MVAVCYVKAAPVRAARFAFAYNGSNLHKHKAMPHSFSQSSSAETDSQTSLTPSPTIKGLLFFDPSFMKLVVGL